MNHGIQDAVRIQQKHLEQLTVAAGLNQMKLPFKGQKKKSMKNRCWHFHMVHYVNIIYIM